MLRLGIIFAVTGVIALAHLFLASSRRLPAGIELAIGIVLVVVGVPLIILGARSAGRPRT